MPDKGCKYRFGHLNDQASCVFGTKNHFFIRDKAVLKTLEMKRIPHISYGT